MPPTTSRRKVHAVEKTILLVFLMGHLTAGLEHSTGFPGQRRPLRSDRRRATGRCRALLAQRQDDDLPSAVDVATCVIFLRSYG